METAFLTYLAQEICYVVSNGNILILLDTHVHCLLEKWDKKSFYKYSGLYLSGTGKLLIWWWRYTFSWFIEWFKLALRKKNYIIFPEQGIHVIIILIWHRKVVCYVEPDEWNGNFFPTTPSSICYSNVIITEVFFYRYTGFTYLVHYIKVT